MNIATEDCQLVLEDDETEIDEDVDIVTLAGSTFILLGKGQCWTKPSSTSATSASVSEPKSPKFEALSPTN